MKVADVITDRIIKKLEEGTVPWQRPWSGGSVPKNLVSKKEYRGVNSFVLGCSEFSSPYWATYKQISDLGGTVIKGQHGSPVLFYTWLEDKRVGVERKIPFMRYYTVFNLEQCEIPVDKMPGVNVKPTLFEAIDTCESVINGMPLRPEIKFNGQRACYSPSTDTVNMPKKESFSSPEAYYSAMFHELSHSTLHEKRLNRKGTMSLGAFGSEAYSMEELIAEMSSCYISNHCGIDTKVIDNSASYIANWLKVLKNDKLMIIKASSNGQKASDFILNKTFGDVA